MTARRPLIHLTRDSARATGDGIYGVIVGAAVVAASHARTAVAVTAAVLVTLTVYWTAERYARIVAERIHEGQRPAWHTVRAQVTTGWEIVTASFLPLMVLLVTRLFGAQLVAAAIASLVCSTVLLCLYGWQVGSRGRLTTAERLVSTAVSGAFGIALIGLKAFLH